MHANRTRRHLGLLVLAGIAFGAAGCSSTIHDQARVGGLNTLSLDAKQRLVFVRNDDAGLPIVCAEPSPDAIVAISAALAGNADVTRASGENIKAAFGAGSSESVASIAMRTASVQMLRDGYYRLCEGAMNGTIDRQAYLRIVQDVDTFIASVMAVDAISGTQHPPAIAISGGRATATASAPGSSTAVAGSAEGLFIEDLTIAEADVAKRRIEAEAIQDIATMYLQHKCYARGVCQRKPHEFMEMPEPPAGGGD